MEYRITIKARLLSVMPLDDAVKNIKNYGGQKISALINKSKRIATFKFNIKMVVCSEATDEEMRRNIIDLVGDDFVITFKWKVIDVNAKILTPSKYLWYKNMR